MIFWSSLLVELFVIPSLFSLFLNFFATKLLVELDVIFIAFLSCSWNKVKREAVKSLSMWKVYSKTFPKNCQFIKNFPLCLWIFKLLTYFRKGSEIFRIFISNFLVKTSKKRILKLLSENLEANIDFDYMSKTLKNYEKSNLYKKNYSFSILNYHSLQPIHWSSLLIQPLSFFHLFS